MFPQTRLMLKTETPLNGELDGTEGRKPLFEL